PARRPIDEATRGPPPNSGWSRGLRGRFRASLVSWNFLWGLHEGLSLTVDRVALPHHTPPVHNPLPPRPAAAARGRQSRRPLSPPRRSATVAELRRAAR